MGTLEGYVIGLLLLTTLAIAWFAGVVVYRLYKGQR